MTLGALLLSPLKTEKKTRGSLKPFVALNQGGCIFARLKFKDLVHDHQKGMGETEQTTLMQNQEAKGDWH